jgi:hypothetical protein
MCEKVDHPSHYGGDTVYEVIKVMEAWLTRDEFVGAMKFTIHCYLARAKRKGSEAEDYRKAQFYQNYLVKYLETHDLETHV